MATTTADQPQSSLRTPLSGTYPSELRSPMASTPTFIKMEDGSQKTPISPPAAYLDYLKTLSPALTNPPSASRSDFPQRPPTLTSTDSSDTVVTLATDASDTTSTPAVPSRTSTAESTTSNTASSASESKAASRSSSCSSCHDPAVPELPQPCTSSSSKVDPNMKISIPPPSQFTRPLFTRTPRRLHIPPSPRSASVRSPMSAHSVTSMYSPHSMTTSPQEIKSPYSAGLSNPVTVSVRQVTTRTVMYSRPSNPSTPVVDPVPPNKKRKTD